MTMKIADFAPEETQLIDVSERLSELLSTPPQSPIAVPDLGLDPSYVDAARTLLTSLSEQVAVPGTRELPLTRQQLESYLDFDPEFIDVARSMLHDFIVRTDRSRG
jgi:hypothetical protein